MRHAFVSFAPSDGLTLNGLAGNHASRCSDKRARNEALGEGQTWQIGLRGWQRQMAGPLWRH